MRSRRGLARGELLETAVALGVALEVAGLVTDEELLGVEGLAEIQ